MPDTIVAKDSGTVKPDWKAVPATAVKQEGTVSAPGDQRRPAEVKVAAYLHQAAAELIVARNNRIGILNGIQNFAAQIVTATKETPGPAHELAEQIVQMARRANEW